MTYMTTEERQELRNRIACQTADYLARGRQIRVIKAGEQSHHLDGVSFSERTRMEKQARLKELGLTHFDQLVGLDRAGNQIA